MNRNKNKININNQIKSHTVRLIDSDGSMIGISSIESALSYAHSKGLDLIEISPTATPPVCKVEDFGKYSYSVQKKEHALKKKQKTVEVKEIKMRPSIAQGDYEVKLRNAGRFLQKGNKVRVTLLFKGREVTHNDVGFNVMNKFCQDIEEHGIIEVHPKMERRQIFMVIAPK